MLVSPHIAVFSITVLLAGAFAAYAWRRRRLSNPQTLEWLALGLLSSFAILMRGETAWARAHLAPWQMTFLEIFISTAAAVLGLLLLWKVSTRLAAARAQTRADRSALRESETRYRAISDLTTDTIYSLQIDNTGAIELEWVSESFASATGYTHDDLRRHDGWYKILHPCTLR